MKRSASALWQGGFKDGRGHLSTASGALHDAPYAFQARFGEGAGTNPEELIAAAHAGCFTMALAARLGEAGFTPERLQTGATVTLETVGGEYSITAVHLALVARIAGIEQARFESIAKQAKQGCPVSKLLNATISLDARLEN